MKKYLVAGVVAGVLSLGSGGAQAQVHHCHPFKGPGDNLVHSTHFRTKLIGCHKAHRVILAGIHHGQQRHHFHALGRKWTTHRTGSYPPLGYKQVWLGGHKRIWLTWID